MKQELQRSGNERRQGIALVVVLGFVSLLMLMIVGFAISQRVERLVARAWLDGVKAEQLIDVALSRSLVGLQQFMEDEGQYFPDFSKQSGHPDVWGFGSGGGTGPRYTDEFMAQWFPSDLWDAIDAQVDAMGWQNINDATGQAVGRWSGLAVNCSGLLDANRVFEAARTNEVQRKNLYLSNELLDEFRQDQVEEITETAFVQARRDRWVQAFTLGELNTLNDDTLRYATSNLFVHSYFPEEDFVYDGETVTPLIVKNWYATSGGRDNALWRMVDTVHRDEIKTKLTNMLSAYKKEGNTLSDVNEAVDNIMYYMDDFNEIMPHPTTWRTGSEGAKTYSRIDAANDFPMLNEISVVRRLSVMEITGDVILTVTISMEGFFPQLAADRTLWGYAPFGGRNATFSIRWEPVGSGWVIPGRATDYGGRAKALGVKVPWEENGDTAAEPMESIRLWTDSHEWTANTRRMDPLPEAISIPGVELDYALILWRNHPSPVLRPMYFDGIPFEDGKCGENLPNLRLAEPRTVTAAEWSSGVVSLEDHWECVDPRFNHLWGSAWKKVSDPSLGTINAEAKKVYEQPDRDGHWSMRRGSRSNERNIRTRFESAACLGGAAYDKELMWKTIPLVGSDAMPIFEYMRFCNEEADYDAYLKGQYKPAGGVNMLSNRENVTASVFYKRGADMMQDEMRPTVFGTNTVSAAEARALARVIVNKTAEAAAAGSLPENTFEALRLVSYKDLMDALPSGSVAKNKHSIDRIIGQIYDSLKVRQNIFTLVLKAQSGRDSNNNGQIEPQEVTGERQALAVVWRDPVKTNAAGTPDPSGSNRTKVLYFQWLEN